MSGGVDKAAYDARWHEIWRGGLQPGQQFDKGRSSPQLEALLGTSSTTTSSSSSSNSSSQRLEVQGKRVLVPGCGRGYDVCAFAAAGAALAVGLDLSEEAVAAARAECAARLQQQEAALGACELAAGDFFAYAHPSGAAFDVGWDYTFLCALHPSMRQDWAAAWARLLAPGGLLVTMIYPVNTGSSAADTGPPWPVTPELYRGLLLPAGFAEVHVGEVPHSLSHAVRAGREWLGLWRR